MLTASKVNTEMTDFLKKFDFQQQNSGRIGIERERFLVDDNGFPTPRSPEFLRNVDDPIWTYELSACQIEDRTPPLCETDQIKDALIKNDKTAEQIAKKMGVKLRIAEVAEENMPLDVYPDPRYLEIIKTISPERLRAACRVTATHIHIGMPNLDEAIETANYLRNFLDIFCIIGDHSHGERLKLYKTMASSWQPPYYRNNEHFLQTAIGQGFVSNPRDCWHLIRISRHGTVELRMFGVTESIDEICGWIAIVKNLIKKM